MPRWLIPVLIGVAVGAVVLPKVKKAV